MCHYCKHDRRISPPHSNASENFEVLGGKIKGLGGIGFCSIDIKTDYLGQKSRFALVADNSRHDGFYQFQGFVFVDVKSNSALIVCKNKSADRSFNPSATILEYFLSVKKGSASKPMALESSTRSSCIYRIRFITLS